VYVKVHVYSLCWNEQEMLPFYFRHYREVATKFVILDDSSSDGSAEYLRAQSDVDLDIFHKDHDSLLLATQRFYNEHWKKSRGEADWVIICNIDEHLHHPRLNEYLENEKSKGVTVIPAKGFQMITDDFPASQERLSETRRRGMPWARMDKLSIFDPNAIDEIGYTVGRHTAAPRGHVIFPATTSCAPDCARRILPTVGVTNIYGQKPKWSATSQRSRRARLT
jgi:hypothetical protein